MPRTFLLADDDGDDREIFKMAMDKVAPSFNFLSFRNGFEAIQHLKTSSLVDLIFLDINMPVMDGWECMRLLKQDSGLKEIPVIIYSTSSHEKDIQHARKAGAKCFFTKPDDLYTLNDILAHITKRLDEHCFGGMTRSRDQPYLECFC